MGKHKTCPRCGHRMVLIATRFGKFWECTNPRCRHREAA